MIWAQPKVYAAKHIDKAVVSASRSGGVFTAVSDFVLQNSGVVYGCILTEDFLAVHVRTEDSAGRDAMRGSKYIQSKIGDTYRNVKIDLDAGRIVLFTGTSCQVAGLRGFLGKEYERLICLDIVCHGVPSPVVWKAYLKWQEKKSNATVMAVDFRNKRDFGWRQHMETLTMIDGNRFSRGLFASLFYTHNILRPSCYECPFKSVMHPGDITIADYWGIEKAAPEFDDNKGVSLVLINNEWGAKVFKQVKENLIWKETEIENSMQPPLVKAYPKPDTRDIFWAEFNKKGFTYIAKKYGGYGNMNRVKRFLQKLEKKIRRFVK